jgi:hypothetical protein
MTLFLLLLYSETKMIGVGIEKYIEIIVEEKVLEAFVMELNL